LTASAIALTDKTTGQAGSVGGDPPDVSELAPTVFGELSA
jgi:hypothetical protein